MKSFILSLGALLLLALSATSSFAQATASVNPAECAKICSEKPNCTPADCAKVCSEKPGCKPADCAKMASNANACAKMASTKTSGVEAAFAILVNPTSKTACCSKIASTQAASCSSSTKSSKIASNN